MVRYVFWVNWSATINVTLLSFFPSYVEFPKLWWRIPEGRCIFWEVGVKGRSHYFHRHLPVLEALQKTNCVKWGKDAGAHSPVVHSFFPPTLHTYINTCVHTHQASVITAPHLLARGWGWGVRRRSFFTVIIHSFLCHETDWGKGWNWRSKVSDVVPQQATASNNMECHFYSPTADVPQLHVSSVHTMVGIFYWGHGEDHKDHPLTGRSSFNP